MIPIWLFSLLVLIDNITISALAEISSIFPSRAAAVQLPLRRSICQDCNRPSRVCICDTLPPSPIRTSTLVLVLQHPAETKRKHTGTATLLSKCLSKCNIVRGTHFVPRDLKPLKDAVKDGVRPLLLFPGPSARQLLQREGVVLSGDDASDRGESARSVEHTSALLIAIDGTWRQAHHMLRHSPDLVAEYDIVCLPEGNRSELDSLRREPASHCTSTAEAVAAALSRIEPTDAAAEAAEYIQSSVRAMVGKQLKYCDVAPMRTETQKQRSLRRSLSVPSEVANASVMQQTSNSDETSREMAECTILYERVEPIRVPLINSFYRSQKYRAVAKRSDVVWVARCASDATLMAAMRLVPKRCAELGTVYFLRNLFVLEVSRRRGIGKNLVRAAVGAEAETMPCYCFADEELVPLYRAAGLEVLDVSTLPKWMVEEFTRVSRQQEGTLVLLGRGVNIDARSITEVPS